MQSALESARQAMLDADGPKFAAHIVFYGAADIQYRDQKTDGAPMLFFHGEDDNWVPTGPTREFAAWAQSKGNPVTFISYPGAHHEFDVAGTRGGTVRKVQTRRHCDAVIDLSTGSFIRMDHKEVTGITPEAFADYLRSCTEYGADIYYSPASRADAVQKVHHFLQQVFRIGA
jgi:dienelactone hydrolase